jgi:UDP-N-acetyl-D-galactosamine dehydrogenase
LHMYESLIDGKTKLAVVGLGYVGLPMAVEFAKHVQVIGYDNDHQKIALYQQGIDPINEIDSEDMAANNVEFTSDASCLAQAHFIIVAVPTPIHRDKTPNLAAVIEASKTIGRYLQKGSIVVYESTVFPGVTEEICAPILEQASGLICGEDFKVGYSPERINPGDKVNRLDTIVKIVSGIDEESLNIIAQVYELVVKAGVFKAANLRVAEAANLRVAEAAKLVENAQRDINIAFMNELALFFDRIGLDTKEVIKAMETKWNALHFTPGLVGGHCIGVDPYYFIYQAEKIGYNSQIILAGRKINDSMGGFVADKVIRSLIAGNKLVRTARIYICGLSFKENCRDMRNSKVWDIMLRLQGYGCDPFLVDPVVDSEEVEKVYGKKLVSICDIHDADSIIFAVAHREFARLTFKEINAMYKDLPGEQRSIVDVKRMFDKKTFIENGYSYWGL